LTLEMHYMAESPDLNPHWTPLR